MKEPTYYFIREKTGKKRLLLVKGKENFKIKKSLFKKRDLEETSCYYGHFYKVNMNDSLVYNEGLPVEHFLSFKESNINTINNLSEKEKRKLVYFFDNWVQIGDYKTFIELFLKGKSVLLANKYIQDEKSSDAIEMLKIDNGKEIVIKNEIIPSPIEVAGDEYKRIMSYRGEFKNGWFIHHKNSLKIKEISAIEEMDEFLIKFIFQQESIEVDEVHPEDLVLIKEELFKKEVF